MLQPGGTRNSGFKRSGDGAVAPSPLKFVFFLIYKILA